MKLFYLWIPALILYNIFYALLSKKINIDKSITNILFLYGYGAAIQIWVFVSLFSKNLVFDALLFDIILILTTPMILLFLQGKPITVSQIFGILFCLFGVWLIK